MNKEIHRAADLTLAAVRLTQLFTPSAPVTSRHLLGGRLEQIRQVLGVVGQVGQHAMVYGERGVGKTSVASLVHVFWTDAMKDLTGLVAGRVQCDRDDTYASVWQKALQSLEYDLARRKVEPSSNGSFAEQAALIEAGDANPTSITRYFTLLDKKAVILIDEMDTVLDYEFQSSMASTLKMLSDFAIDVTLILVGVADSIDGLIAEHQSVDRCLVQILMPRMSIGELEDIVITRLENVGMTIHPEALLRIAAFSQGFPQYAHLFGLHSAVNAIQHRSDLAVRNIDVDAALKVAVRESQQSVLNAYNQAVTSPQPTNLYKAVLLACAIAKGDDLGYFAPADVRQPFSKIMGASRDISAFAKQLAALTDQERGSVLQRSGGSHMPRYRFWNALVRPYVAFRGIEEGMISEAEAYMYAHPEIAEQLPLFPQDKG
jgi:hypothetical protein